MCRTFIPWFKQRIRNLAFLFLLKISLKEVCYFSVVSQLKPQNLTKFSKTLLKLKIRVCLEALSKSQAECDWIPWRDHDGAMWVEKAIIKYIPSKMRTPCSSHHWISPTLCQSLFITFSQYQDQSLEPNNKSLIFTLGSEYRLYGPASTASSRFETFSEHTPKPDWHWRNFPCLSQIHGALRK